MNITSSALKNFDEKTKKNIKYLDRATYDIKFKDERADFTTPSFDCYNKKEEIVFTGTHNIIGWYYMNEHKWIWGWYIPFDNTRVTKNLTYTSRKLLNYALNLELPNSSKIDKEFISLFEIRRMLLSNVIYIDHPFQLEIIIAIAQYLTKADLVIREHMFPNVLVYKILTFTHNQNLDQV